MRVEAYSRLKVVSKGFLSFEVIFAGKMAEKCCEKATKRARAYGGMRNMICCNGFFDPGLVPNFLD